MKTFAFLFNPVELKHIHEFWPVTYLMPGFFLRSFLKDQGFKISPLKTFTSKLGKQIQGYFIVSPLLPEQDLELEQELVLDKIISASYGQGPGRGHPGSWRLRIGSRRKKTHALQAF